jgi:hypothetical protein
MYILASPRHTCALRIVYKLISVVSFPLHSLQELTFSLELAASNDTLRYMCEGGTALGNGRFRSSKWMLA